MNEEQRTGLEQTAARRKVEDDTRRKVVEYTPRRNHDLLESEVGVERRAENDIVESNAYPNCNLWSKFLDSEIRSECCRKS